MFRLVCCSQPSHLNPHLTINCANNINSQVDIPTVAKHFGITNHAARMRLERLGKKLDKMEASTNPTKSDEETHVKDKAQTKKQTEVNTDEGDTMSD